MGGFVRGKIECYISNKAREVNSQNIFKNLYDFFTSHPQYTLISLNYGSTVGPALSGAGTGTEYLDGTTLSVAAGAPKSFGNNAFFVVRQNASPARNYDVFHLFQWVPDNNAARGTTFGVTPGNPGLVNGNSNPIASSRFYIAHACAIGVSGSGGTVPGNIYGASTSGSLQNGFGNPWRGGMNAMTGVLGIDIKGQSPNPVWGHPLSSGSYGTGTGVMIFPRSNDGDTGAYRWSSTVGHFAENMGGIADGDGTDSDIRMNIIADDDSWVFWHDFNDSNNGSTCLSYAGIYQPRNNFPSGTQATITPYMCIQSWNALPLTLTTNASVYGDLIGTSAQQGGIIGNTTASVRPLIMDNNLSFAADTNFQPNQQMSGAFGGKYSTGYYDEFQVPVGIFETTPTQVSGYLGQLDFIRTMFNFPVPAVRWDFNRAVAGSTAVAGLRHSIPWDSQNNTVPRTGTSRQGINFIRPPTTF